MKLSPTYLITACIMTLLFVSCSSDNDNNYFAIPEVPGIDLKEDNIQLVFCPTSNYTTLQLLVETKIGEDIHINWGDDNLLHPYPQGEIEHEFSGEETAYIVTIQSPGIKSFKITEEGSTRIRSLFLGECPELMNLSFTIQDNMFRDLDLRACPQFSDAMWMNIYDPLFDLNGLKNFNAISLNIHCYIPIHFEGFQTETLALYFSRGLPEFIVKDSPNLNKIVLFGIGNNCVLYDGKMEIDAPAVTELGISNLDFRKAPDFSKMTALTRLYTRSIDCDETFPVPPSVMYFEIENQFIENYRLRYLDLRHCKDLRYVLVAGVRNLEYVNLDGLENLENVWIHNSGHVEDYRYEKESFNMATGRSVSSFDNNPSIIELKASY